MKSTTTTEKGAPLEAQAIFFRRLATLVKAGIRIDQAVEVQTDSESPALGAAAEEITRKIQTGHMLSQSMARYPKIFSPVAVGLVRSGEHSGSLGGALDRLADLTERNVRLKKMLISALTYPAVLAVVILLLSLFVVLVICPQDDGIFSVFGGELPWPSRVLTGLSAWLRDPFAVTVGVGVVTATVLILGAWLRRSEDAREKLDEIVLRSPVLGALVRKMTAARVLYVMLTTVQVGLNVGASLALAERVVSNRVLRRRFQSARENVMEGEGVGRALARHKVLPGLVTSMIEVGEESGHLDEAMARVADVFDDEVEAALLNLARLLEPMLLAVAGLAAGFVALAALLPIMQFTTQL